jgi:hypothetical protein
MKALDSSNVSRSSCGVQPRYLGIQVCLHVPRTVESVLRAHGTRGGEISFPGKKILIYRGPARIVPMHGRRGTVSNTSRKIPSFQTARTGAMNRSTCPGRTSPKRNREYHSKRSRFGSSLPPGFFVSLKEPVCHLVVISHSDDHCICKVQRNPLSLLFGGVILLALFHPSRNIL